MPLPVPEPEPLPDFEALPLLLPDFLSSLGAAATPVAHSRRAVTSRMVDARIRLVEVPGKMSGAGRLTLSREKKKSVASTDHRLFLESIM